MAAAIQNETATSNYTITFGASPCRACGARDRTAFDFHGSVLTMCRACGYELPASER